VEDEVGVGVGVVMRRVVSAAVLVLVLVVLFLWATSSCSSDDVCMPAGEEVGWGKQARKVPASSSSLV